MLDASLHDSPVLRYEVEIIDKPFRNFLQTAKVVFYDENRKKIDRKKPRKPMSEAAKKHLSEIQIGIKRGPYSKAHGLAVSKGRMGMKFTDKHKENLKKAAQNRIKRKGHQND